MINGLTKKEQKKLASLEKQLADAGGRGVALAEEIDDLRRRQDEPEQAAEAYENLLQAADGNSFAGLTQFDATTFIAMLDDHRYRAKVRKWHEEVYS